MAVETRLSTWPERTCFDDSGKFLKPQYSKEYEGCIEFYSLNGLGSDFCHGDPCIQCVLWMQ